MFKPGQMVKFKEPDIGEMGLKFRVIQDRDTRVLVQHDDSPMSIKPTFVCNVADLERAA